MTALLNWRIWVLIALAIGQAAFGWKMYSTGKQAGLQQLEEYKLAETQQTAQALYAASVKAQTLQDEKDKLRKTKDVQIAHLNTDLASALDRLRSRPERPREGDLPSNPAPGSEPSCTGAGLYRPDADFLVREAARAKRLQLDLGECQAAYESARQALK